MHIPVVIFKDTGSVYGVNVPDIQGVHSWGDSVEDALNNVLTAITSHIETFAGARRTRGNHAKQDCNPAGKS